MGGGGGWGDKGWGGGGVSKYKNTPLPSSTAVKRFIQGQEFLFVYDDSGLSVTGPDRQRTEFL
jgi:hypothetical protein